MLTIWGRRSAFNVQKALWLIGELGLDHRHIDAGGAFGGLDTPEFRAMNPHGRIPVIDDDGHIVWESGTIIRYLSARYGGDAFWPADAARRSMAERWMDWSLATLQRGFMDLFWSFYRMPAAQRDQNAIARLVAAWARHYRLLDAELSHREYLAGAEFSIADIPAGTTLYRYFNIDVERPDIPKVESWYQRLSQRPAYREHVTIEFSELKGRRDF